MNDQNVLVHHGVKGQKWGVRRTPEQLGHAPSKKRKFSIKIRSKNDGKKQSESRSKDSEPTKKKTVKDMSDDEIRQIINRIELERKYSQLTAKQKSKGRKVVESILAESAKKTATKYTSKAMDKVVENLLKKVNGSRGGRNP